MYYDEVFEEAVPGEMTKLVIKTSDAERARSGANSERVWVECVGHRRFKITNLPWFVDGLAYEDLVEGEPYGEVYRFTKLIKSSGWWNVICLFDPPADVEQINGFMDQVTALGGTVEGAYWTLISVGIPPDVAPEPILAKITEMHFKARFGSIVSKIGTSAVGRPPAARCI